MGNNPSNTILPAAAGCFRETPYPLICKDEAMCPKAYGTCPQPVMKLLRWGCDREMADRICCYNRHDAEGQGYFQEMAEFLEELEKGKEITFYDSVTGKPLFIAPRGRTMEEFKKESISHGWPSFRDAEVVWSNVRCLADSGESISTSGTHLGHNLPDERGNRYCINLVSVAGRCPPPPPPPLPTPRSRSLSLSCD